MVALHSDFDVLSAFGLTAEQTLFLFSLEKLLARKEVETDKDKKQAILKEDWINRWTTSVEQVLTNGNDLPSHLISDQSALVDAFKNALSDSTVLTWYYLILLEAVTFRAYTPLGKDKASDKVYSKLHYKVPTDFLKELVTQVGIGSPDLIDRYLKMYNKAIRKGSGAAQKAAIKVLTVIAAGAVVAAGAGAFAGPIAVALFGADFAGLGGASLTAACLAFIGGGAIAAGGAGMAGGVLAIVGGGALLGVAGGGAAVAGFSLMESSPELALSQAAKLDVVLREIILNGQHDVKMAQSILERYKEQIANMQKEVERLKLEHDTDKNLIKNLARSIKYMEILYRDSETFTSSFGIGVAAVPRQNTAGE